MRSLCLTLLMLLACFPCEARKHEAVSQLMGRVFRYADCYGDSLRGTTHNIYLRYSYTTRRRNFLLWLVPSLYTIANGSRSNLGETWGQLRFGSDGGHTIEPQVQTGSVEHRKRVMPTMMKYTAPGIYRVAMFDDEILSPFYHSNRYYYRYRETWRTDREAMISFTPRLKNTQLVRGSALIDTATGRVVRVRLVGESDMIAFDTSIEMGRKGNSLLPKTTATKAKFSFMGNRITSTINSAYAPPPRDTAGLAALPDTAKMARLRPDSLDEFETSIYNMYYERKHRADSTSTKSQRMTKAAWDFVGSHMINSTTAKQGNAYVRVSPLFNPLYMSYSQHRGLSYKLRVRGSLRLGPASSLSFNPFMGYNFRIKKLYYTLPLRLNIDESRDRWVEASFRSGNRLYNSSVVDGVKQQYGDKQVFDSLALNEFNDYELQFIAHWRLAKRLWMEAGAVWHNRPARNQRAMQALGRPTVYKSFSPRVQLSAQPWPAGPVLSSSYERSIAHIMGSNMKYEKYEADMSYKKLLTGKRQYNLRLGWGQFTNSETDYFLDYDNFHENYLPGGWDDDYSGEFQLLPSRWYNQSKYYVRGNLSYESPLLIARWLPLVGRYIESERLYLSAVSLQHTRGYAEYGYGLTTRFISIGLFVATLGGEIERTGVKFTFELFRKW